jgi:Rps23 Pro-64 3,4-dihydroxylase Tpa1-like proline 4-hydroxylase
MNELLKKQNYIILPNFISQERAENLGKEYKDYCYDNNIDNDPQAPNSHSSYNYISFLELLCEKTPEVSKILEESVLPTYCYSRVYKKGSVLDKHTDRDACEISLTLNLNGDFPWPIWIKTPEGKEKFVSLNPGDAMLYLGRIAEHWRDEYCGEYYTQVFLHYVKSRGECSYAYFDKDKTNENKIKESLHLTEKENDSELKKESTKIIYNIKPENTLESFVKVFDNILSPNLCDEIISTFKDHNINEAKTADSINTEIRNCYALNNCTNFEGIPENIRKHLDEEIYKGISKIIGLYREIYPTAEVSIDTGYNFLTYHEGQYYTQHVDNYLQEQRSLTCSILLNEDYEGGEFALFDRNMLIKCAKGSAIVFPSNFMFPHEVLPVQSGIRYSIVSWMV